MLLLATSTERIDFFPPNSSSSASFPDTEVSLEKTQCYSWVSPSYCSVQSEFPEHKHICVQI